jgi:hypothetical protein
MMARPRLGQDQLRVGIEQPRRGPSSDERSVLLRPVALRNGSDLTDDAETGSSAECTTMVQATVVLLVVLSHVSGLLVTCGLSVVDDIRRTVPDIVMQQPGSASPMTTFIP